MSSASSPRGVGRPGAGAKLNLAAIGAGSPPGRRRVLEHARLNKVRRAASPRSPTATPRSIRDKFRVGRVLGRGSYSVVRLAENRATGARVALKVIKKPRFKAGSRPGPEAEDQLVQLAKEVTLTQMAQHPSVVALHEVVETRQRVYIVMEHVGGGDLFEYVTQRGALPTPEALRIFRQVVDAVDHCHHRNICHRDLKPENILMSADAERVKVADFGLARLTDQEAQCETRCGSPHYMSPEQFSFDGYDGKLADVWSLGAVLYVMVTASMPFARTPGEEALPSLVRAIHKGRYFMPRWVNPLVADLIGRCLTVRPSERITVAEILEHPAWAILDRVEGPGGGASSPREGERPRSGKIRRASLQVLQPVQSDDGDGVVARSVAESGGAPSESPATSGEGLLDGDAGFDLDDDGEELRAAAEGGEGRA